MGIKKVTWFIDFLRENELKHASEGRYVDVLHILERNLYFAIFLRHLTRGARTFARDCDISPYLYQLFCESLSEEAWCRGAARKTSPCDWLITPLLQNNVVVDNLNLQLLKA